MRAYAHHPPQQTCVPEGCTAPVLGPARIAAGRAAISQDTMNMGVVVPLSTIRPSQKTTLQKI